MNANPLAGLRDPLAALAEDARVLPATGRAEEYLQRFDIDEHYDREDFGRERVVDTIRERPGDRLYLPAPPRSRAEDHLFQTFIDGCVRVTFLGTLVDQERVTPIILAQVGAAALRRHDSGRLHVQSPRIELRLILDRRSLTDRAWERLEEAASRSSQPLKIVDSKEKTPYTDDTTYGSVIEPRSRAAHKSNWEMRLLELETLRSVLPERPEGSWVAIDGSLGKEFRELKYPEGFAAVIKNFSKEVVFRLPGQRGATTTRDLHTVISKLPEAHRTVAFGRPDGHVAFWYVRLRSQGALDYPLMGVIKVEVPLAPGEMLETATVDRISSCLVAERTVAPHGRDARWHAHLYPIHMTEQAIRARFATHTVLRAAIQWPRLTLTGGSE